ncbi:MAG: AAA family ATPase [Verrucomicrobiales bacterium]
MEVFDDYSSPLSTRALLLIDEVDLHLHPKWQRAIYDFLDTRLPNCQLIVTTHSPVTAQQADESVIQCLIRDRTSVHLESFAGDPGKTLISQLLMSAAFGLKTDESVEMEKARERYEKLRDKKRRTKKESKELTELKKRHAEYAGFPQREWCYG